MPSASNQNPYAIGAGIERCDVAWTDGELEFTNKEIRVPGDTELPQLCIHLGVDHDLVRREQTLRAMPTSSRRLQTIFIVLLCLPVAAISWMPPLTGLVQLRWPVVLILYGIAILPFFTARKVQVTWYLCRSYALPKEKWRKRFLALILLTAGVTLVMVYLSGSSSWIAVLVPVAVIAVVLGNERTIGVRSYTDDRFILRGHSAAFAEAWAAQTAAAELSTPEVT